MYIDVEEVVYLVLYSYISNWGSTGMVANPTRGQLNRKHDFFSVPVRA